MRNPLAGALGAKTVLGLHITPGFLGAVQVYNTLRGPEVDRVAFRELGEGETALEILPRFLAEEELNAEAVVTSLPTSKACIREVEAALRDPKKLKRIIKYQAEPVVPFPIESAVADFLVGGEPGNALVAVVEKEHLKDHLDPLREAGIEPEMVSLDDAAIYALHRRACGLEKGQKAVALVRLGTDRDGVQIVRNGRLVLLRTVPEGEAGESALVETLRLDKLRNPGSPVREVWLTGEGAADQGRISRLKERLGMNVKLWRPFDAFKGGAGPMDDALQSRLSVPLGLAMMAREPQAERMDFRKEEFQTRSASQSRGLVVFTLCALVLLTVLGTFHVYQRVFLRERALDALSARMETVYLEAFPGSVVIKSREKALMSQRVQEEMSKYEGLEVLHERGRLLDALMGLTRAVSSIPRAQVDDFSSEATNIRLGGTAPSFEAVDRLKETLGEDRRFRAVELVSAKMDKKSGQVRFKLSMEHPS